MGIRQRERETASASLRMAARLPSIIAVVLGNVKSVRSFSSQTGERGGFSPEKERAESTLRYSWLSSSGERVKQGTNSRTKSCTSGHSFIVMLDSMVVLA